MWADEWQACREPATMLNALCDGVSERKAKLFRCACRSLVWQGLLRERSPGDAAGEMLTRLVAIAAAGGDELSALIANYEHRCAPYWESCPGLKEWLGWLISGTRFGPQVANVIRELWANPLAPPRISQSCRTDTVLGLAAHVLHTRDFSVMPILADALQDAGCESQQLLNHCRQPDPHLFGCWAVDLILGLD